MARRGEGRPGDVEPAVAGEELVGALVRLQELHEAVELRRIAWTDVGSLAGEVLSLIQRMFFSAGSKVVNKPAAAVCVCRRGGATAAFQTLNMPFEMMNMPVVTSQYWNIVYGREEGQAALDTEGMQTMRTMANNMAWLLKKIHANGSPDYPIREEWQPMNFIR